MKRGIMLIMLIFALIFCCIFTGAITTVANNSSARKNFVSCSISTNCNSKEFYFIES